MQDVRYVQETFRDILSTWVTLRPTCLWLILKKHLCHQDWVEYSKQ
jgi:hypothetical protein